MVDVGDLKRVEAFSVFSEKQLDEFHRSPWSCCRSVVD